MAKKLSHSLNDNSSLREEDGHLSFNHGASKKSYRLEGLNDFTLTSEYLEKDIVIDDEMMTAYNSTVDEGDITTIKIFKESGIEEIGPESLKQYIEKNKDIKKVVIEKVSLEEASRVSLFFEPDTKKKPLELISNGQELNHSVDLSSFEDDLNSSFLKDSLGSLEDSKTESSIRANFSLKGKSSIVEEKKNDFEMSSEAVQESYQDENVRKEYTHEQAAQEESAHDMQDGANGKLSYEKHSLTRKRSRKSASYYYRVNDHMELFKVGSSYLRDYQSGIKSMGFSSYNLQEEGEKTIFGISSFFNYHDDLNICIVTNHLEGSFYTSILGELEVRTDIYTDENVEYDLFHADGNDFISFDEIINIECQSNHTGPEDFIDYLSEKYDLILWDLPSLEYMNNSREIFFPIVRALESLTLIVAAEVSRGRELDTLISYFEKYQVPIKGVLFSGSNKKNKKTKKNKKLKELKNDSRKKEARNGFS